MLIVLRNTINTLLEHFHKFDKKISVLPMTYSRTPLLTFWISTSPVMALEFTVKILLPGSTLILLAVIALTSAKRTELYLLAHKNTRSRIKKALYTNIFDSVIISNTFKACIIYQTFSPMRPAHLLRPTKNFSPKPCVATQR